MRSAIALIACACMLGLVNWSVAQKERLLERGRIVLLELAPVDPRSLMQGDYMALQFAIARDTREALMKARVGETVKVKAPRGTMEFKILEIVQ